MHGASCSRASRSQRQPAAAPAHLGRVEGTVTDARLDAVQRLHALEARLRPVGQRGDVHQLLACKRKGADARLPAVGGPSLTAVRDTGRHPPCDRRAGCRSGTTCSGRTVAKGLGLQCGHMHLFVALVHGSVGALHKGRERKAGRHPQRTWSLIESGWYTNCAQTSCERGASAAQAL